MFGCEMVGTDDRRYGVSLHGREHVYGIDVDGVRLVIDAFAPKASETVKAEVQRIVESIDIGP